MEVSENENMKSRLQTKNIPFCFRRLTFSIPKPKWKKFSQTLKTLKHSKAIQILQKLKFYGTENYSMWK